MSTRRIGRAAGAGTLALVLLPCGCNHPTESAETKPAVVRVVPVVEKKITDYTFFPGRTAAVESVDVRARVNGYLDSIDFKPGEEVKKDQRLFKIDPRPYKAEFDRAKGSQNLAEAQLKLAVADYARAQAISRSPGAISKEELDKSLASQETAQASVTAAVAAVESSALNLKFTDVLSPIDGVVGRNFITVGNLVGQDQTLLTTIVSLDPIYGYFDVDEQTLLRVRAGMRDGRIAVKRQGEIPVELGLADEDDRYPHKGFVDFVNTQLDASTGTIQLRGVFQNPKPPGNVPRLLAPGMFVRVRVPIGEPHAALLVPQASIGRDQGRKYVMVVGADSKVDRRYVELGAEQPGGLQVVEPAKVQKENGDESSSAGQAEAALTAGDSVIVTGLQKIHPGMTVEAKPMAPSGKGS